MIEIVKSFIGIDWNKKRIKCLIDAYIVVFSLFIYIVAFERDFENTLSVFNIRFESVLHVIESILKILISYSFFMSAVLYLFFGLLLLSWIYRKMFSKGAYLINDSPCTEECFQCIQSQKIISVMYVGFPFLILASLNSSYLKSCSGLIKQVFSHGSYLLVFISTFEILYVFVAIYNILRLLAKRLSHTIDTL